MAQFGLNIDQNVHYLCKVKKDAWEKGSRAMMAELALEYATSLYRHSLPAPGNDPLQGNGGTAKAMEQGIYNVTKDINSMFYPLSKHSIKELVGMRSDLVFQLDSPLWQDPQLEKAWNTRDMDVLFMTFQTLGTATGESDYLNLEKTNFAEVSDNNINYVETPSIELQQSAMKNGRWDRRTTYAVKNAAVIKAFIAARIKSVGSSANGWVDCIKKLKGVVSSIMPGRGVGEVTISDNPHSLTYFIKNEKGNPNNQLDKAIQKVSGEIQQLQTSKARALVDLVAKISIPKLVPKKRNRSP